MVDRLGSDKGKLPLEEQHRIIRSLIVCSIPPGFWLGWDILSVAALKAGDHLYQVWPQLTREQQWAMAEMFCITDIPEWRQKLEKGTASG